MKLLIAYDGSDCATAALDDLTKAGLPLHDVEATIVAIDETPPTFQLPGFANGIFAESNLSTGAFAMDTEGSVCRAAHADKKATYAVSRLQQQFPHWTIEKRALCGSPWFLLVQQIKELDPDLIVAGSHNKNMLQRLLFGSVSKYLADHAACSVHITKAPLFASNGPPRLMLAVDGSEMSMLAVDAIASRHWPAGTYVCVVGVVDRNAFPPEFFANHSQSSAVLNYHQRTLEQALSAVAEKLSDIGLDVSTVCRIGSPEETLEDEARRRHIDCVFLGAARHTLLQRTMCGSVSSTLVANAHCSVEIVRPRLNSDATPKTDCKKRYSNSVQFN